MKFPDQYLDYHQRNIWNIKSEKDTYEKSFGGLLTTYNYDPKQPTSHIALNDFNVLRPETDNPKMFRFDPFYLFGWKWADSFYYDLSTHSGQRWDWKQIKKGDTIQKMDVGDAIREWIAGMGPEMRWVNMKDHCPKVAKARENDPSHMDNVCLVDTTTRLPSR